MLPREPKVWAGILAFIGACYAFLYAACWLATLLPA